MDWSHLSCMACGAIGVWLALTSGKRRCEIESDEPIRLADGWWFPKAKNPPPRPPAPPSITEGRSRGNMKCRRDGRPMPDGPPPSLRGYQPVPVDGPIRPPPSAR